MAAMSNLVAIAYDDEATARNVAEALAQLQADHSIELEDMVVVSRDEKGKVKLHQTLRTVGAGAAGGAVWGGLLGLLFLAPLLGMAVGAAAGAGGGALTDVGVDDDFLKELGRRLDAGHAAVIVLVRRATPDKVLGEIGHFGGHVLQSSLSGEREADLQAALDRKGAPA
jgi:uncharacterized membrane protein